MATLPLQKHTKTFSYFYKKSPRKGTFLFYNILHMACNTLDTAAELSCLPGYFENILGAIIPLIGFLAFIMIIVGGFKILTSSGDAKGMASGKQTITLAVAGIVLSIVSWLILVVIQKITGVSVTQFTFGFN